MKETLNRSFARYQRMFAGFTMGQKVVAVLGTAALVLAGFMVFKWAATPSYAPLYSNLSSEDASAVVEQLDADGVPYEIGNNGGTIMVPQDQVYSTRISLSGEGLPSSSGEGGYSILDNADLSTSQAQEQTNFKRAMEGELSKTIEAIDGVDTAIVHLALPEKQVFADEQAPATASVLVDTGPGDELGPEQVQAIVHTVASSIDGLDPEKVTVADSSGRVLSTTDGTDGAGASTRTQQIEDVQNDLQTKIQTMLDRVVGPGNSTVQVTAEMDFDKAVTESTTYTEAPDVPALSESSSTETYTGPAGGAAGAGGVVGPDGQMDSGLAGTDGSSYEKAAGTKDNAVNSVVEHRESTPGAIVGLNVAAIVDTEAARNIDPGELENMIAAAAGIDKKRGDKSEVTTMPFDRAAEQATAAELKEAAAADKNAERMDLIRKGGMGLLVAVLLLIVWLKGRRRNKARQQATTYVVEQLRQDQANRLSASQQQAALDVSPATMALQRAERDGAGEMRDELATLVERQPEDVAALLRGWLVER
jgi:flagellar M-ring protein FliF